MERNLASAEEIRQAIEARLNSQQELMRDHAMLQPQLPHRAEPDADGCNWHVDVAGDLAGHEDAVSRVVTEMQGLYNLRE